MATPATSQVNPLGPTPFQVPIVLNNGRITDTWNQWLTQALQKINVINEIIANISGGGIGPGGTLPISSGGTSASTASGAFNNLSPLTTNGDILLYDSGNTRLSVGTLSYVLTINPGTGLPSWMPSAGGSSGGTPIVTGELVSYNDTSSVLHIQPQFVYFDNGDLFHQ